MLETAEEHYSQPAETLDMTKSAAPMLVAVLMYFRDEERDRGRWYPPWWLRCRAETEAYFAGLELVEPAVVPVLAWRPDDGPPADPHSAHY